MKFLERYYFAKVEPLRTALLLRLLLWLLAFDCWIDLIPHGGRYGIGAFNVAHFPLLNFFVPSPGLYVGLLLFTGLLSLTMALFRPNRPGMALLFTSYTFSWSMSMLDSYQHHYLISLLLFSMMFFPFEKSITPATPFSSSKRPAAARNTAGLILLFGIEEWSFLGAGKPSFLEQLGLHRHLGEVPFLLLQLLLVLAPALYLFVQKGDAGEVINASSPEPTKPDQKLPGGTWAYRSFATTAAIVYFYTAITKMAPDWREGHALRRLGTSEAFRALETQATGPGLPFFGEFTVEGFWEFMAAGAIGVQLVTCIAFLLAAHQDALPKRWRVPAMLLGLAPLSFHLGAERLQLQIGWFSYYMLVVAVVVFLPASVLRPIAEAVSAPARWLAKLCPSSGVALGLACAGILAYLGAGVALDLPGSVAAGAAASVAFAVFVMRRRTQEDDFPTAGWGVAALLTALLAFGSISQSDVRFDYYRFVGGDHRRRGELQEALAAYEKANAYVVDPHCFRETPRGDPLVCFRDSDDADAFGQAHPELLPFTKDRRAAAERVRSQLAQ